MFTRQNHGQAAANQFHLRSEEDKLTKLLLLPLFERSHRTFNKSGKKIIRLTPLKTELIFISDKKKDEIVSVEEIPAFDVYPSFQETMVYDYENNHPYKLKRKHEVKTDSYEEARDFIAATIPADSFSGGKTVFIGQGKNEEIEPSRNGRSGPVQDIISSSTTQTMRWELRRR